MCSVLAQCVILVNAQEPCLEDVLVEVLLQALIGEVDAQLLEAVDLERLEAVDVEDPDGALRLRCAACRARLMSGAGLTACTLDTAHE